eukprot:5775677-Prymnesium_polylepis.1
MFADTPWDRNGVYSGNIIIDDDGIPTAVYTGNVAGHAKTYGVCARSFDGFVTWNKTDCSAECRDSKLWVPAGASPCHACVAAGARRATL